MEDKILLDENKQYKFDFSECEYVLEFHDLANKSKLNDEVLFIEYKNSNIPGAVNPDAMFRKIKEKPEKFYANIAKKYCDSLLILWACKGNEKDNPISYIFLVEDKLIDKKIRKNLKLKIGKQLPLNLKGENVLRQVLSKFEVYNLKEWESEFPSIKIMPVEE